MILVTKEMIAFVMVRALSSHKNVLFSHRECINLQKAVYETLFLEGAFLCKISTNHQSCKQYPRKVYKLLIFTCFSHRISVYTYKDFVKRKLFRKQGIDVHAAL